MGICVKENEDGKEEGEEYTDTRLAASFSRKTYFPLVRLNPCSSNLQISSWNTFRKLKV